MASTHGRTALLLVLLVGAMLCDASSARRRDYWSIVPPAGPVWADRVSGWCQARLGGTEATGAARRLRDRALAICVAATSLGYLTVRDLRLTLAMHAQQPEETRRTQ